MRSVPVDSGDKDEYASFISDARQLTKAVLLRFDHVK